MENTNYSSCGSCESQLKARSCRKRKWYSASASASASNEEESKSSSQKSKKMKMAPTVILWSHEWYGYGCGIGEESRGGDYKPNCPCEYPTQPVIRSSWAGRFVVYSDLEFTCGVFDGLKACVSTKVPRESVWPKSFESRSSFSRRRPTTRPPPSRSDPRRCSAHCGAHGLGAAALLFRWSATALHHIPRHPLSFSGAISLALSYFHCFIWCVNSLFVQSCYQNHYLFKFIQNTIIVI